MGRVALGVIWWRLPVNGSLCGAREKLNQQEQCKAHHTSFQLPLQRLTSNPATMSTKTKTIVAVYKDNNFQRPPTARKLCDEDHKENVAGLDRKEKTQALKKFFTELTPEEKEYYERKAAEAKEVSLRDLETFVRAARKDTMDEDLAIIESAQGKVSKASKPRAPRTAGRKKAILAKQLGVKPALGAYFAFAADRREAMKTENPGKSAGEISKLLGAAWKTLDEEEREEYKERAAADKKRFDAELAERKEAQPELVAAVDAMPASAVSPKASPKAKRMSGYTLFIKEYAQTHGKTAMAVKAAAWKALGEEGQEEYKERAKALSEASREASPVASRVASRVASPVASREASPVDDLDLSDDEEEVDRQAIEQKLAELQSKMEKLQSEGEKASAYKKIPVDTTDPTMLAMRKAGRKQLKKVNAEISAVVEEQERLSAMLC